MRFGLCAALLAGLSVPAGAQTAADRHDEDLSAALPSPHEVEAMAGAVRHVLGTLLAMDVRPLVSAIDPNHPALRDGARSLGDLAGRDDPHFEERLHDSLDRASGQMNRIVDATTAMVPALRRSIDAIERSLEAAAPPLDEPLD